MRIASYSGDWYPSDPAELRQKLQKFFTEAVKSKRVNGSTRSGGNRKVKALIAPHAGIDFSGAIQACAYINIDNPEQYNRVIVLGPSHHSGMESCGLTIATHLDTPLGEFEIDKEVIA